MPESPATPPWPKESQPLKSLQDEDHRDYRVTHAFSVP